MASTAYRDKTPVAGQGWAWIGLAAGVGIIFIALGMRHSFGLFLPPVTRELGIGREAYGFTIALQNLLWGFGQPIAGIIADKFGSARVAFAGGVMYAAGLALSSIGGATGLFVGLGVLVGLGLSATSFAVVLGAVGRSFPPESRARALGIASVGGSLGIFASVPVTAAAISELGWADALLGLAGLAGAICFLSIGLSRTPGAEADATREQSLVQALVEAGSHRGYVLLVLGFFVCGFQLAFIGTHLPAYLADRAMAPSVGGMALAVVGAANVVGTLACGLLGDRTSKKNLLAVLYLVRAGATVLFLYAPLSVASVLLYAAIMGLTWLGTVPLTSAIVAQVFGPRYMATLVGVVFLMHQVGSFLGAWLGGYFFDRMGSYDPVWWTVAALGVVAAVLHWPIDERPLAVGRRAAA